MLNIHIDEQELFDESTETFIKLKGTNIQLEHSLISLSRWEEKWHIPFLGNEDKTEEQVKDYIRCMTTTKNVDPRIYDHIPASTLKEIFDYIENPMTATWFNDSDDRKKAMPKRKETITSEIIYYWIITLGIPVQFERWHLNRLLTLIRVINIKNSQPKNMSKKEILAHNRKLNAARRAKYKTKG